MSNRYKGAVISATPPTTTGGEEGTASGAWTLEQQMQLQAAGLWPAQPTGPYIEDVFSTFLYTGTGASQTITNGVDLSTNGGLVWAKIRSGFNAPLSHALFDTSRGVLNRLASNLTDAQASTANSLTAFNSTGFTVGSSVTVNGGGAGDSYVSWTFRKQPKFFDVVGGLTSDGSGNLPAFNHSLGSVPGCVLLKATNSGSNWVVYHRSLSGSGANQYLYLNDTAAAANSTGAFVATSTTFQVASGSLLVPDVTYVAYLFAHDAGGFGLTGTDNVISCGGFTHSGANAVQTLGYEPQFLLIKKTNDVGDWKIVDTMRGWSMSGPDLNLYPNTSGAEVDSGMYNPVATGFDWGQNGTFIYIAIRRGPMRVPTVGTSVFAPVAYTGNGTTNTVTTGFVTDLVLGGRRNEFAEGTFDRLRGNGNCLVTSNTNAESGATIYDVSNFAVQNGFGLFENFNASLNAASQAIISWNFKRAPSFFDEVCYTGTGTSSQVLTHNLTVIPALTIFKKRSAANPWDVVSGNTSYLQLNENFAAAPDTSIAATSTTITAPLGAGNGLNASGATYVAYLFATCAGVSKVGSYTGNGSTQTINCGFTGGARFVLIKRTDASGDWYVWDSARGIVAGNDPHLSLNTTAAEVTTDDSVDTDNSGFIVNQDAATNINVTSATYIFLAIA